MIRELTTDDLPTLLPLCREFQAEGGLPGEFVSEKFICSWNNFITLKMGVVFGMYRDGKVVGMLGGIAYNDLNDGKMVVMEMFWYVVKEFRGMGLKLLKTFEAWAIKRGAARLCMACLAGLNSDSMSSLYSRLGYRPLDLTFVKEL